MYSSIKNINGVPTLCANGSPLPGFAYITYRTNNARYEDFAKIGCSLYSVPVFFGSQTINEVSRFPSIAPGIFDTDTPDFSIFDRDMEKICTVCPDAYIFPRINMSLPEKWENDHPDECCDSGFTSHRRACFSSDAWAAETKRLLGLFIDHAAASPYRENIVGYQLAGGNTEEWFSFDQKGSIGKRFYEKFEAYRKKNRIPESGEIHDEELRRFSSVVTAERIMEFAAFAKERTNCRLVIGSFYGYTLECTDPVSCHHALGMILDCPDIDFICSPVSYADNRPAGIDHACMLPVDSLKAHGKLYFAENDTRTHLSKAPNELPHYNNPIWFGPEPEKSREIIASHFARALTHGHAMWWFDMWGGWYADAEYMKLLGDCLEICRDSLTKDRTSLSEVAVFADETAYSKEGCDKRLNYQIRKTLGAVGAPYDIYLIDDYESVREKYKFFVFLCPAATSALDKAISDAGEKGIVIDRNNRSVTPGELRAIFRSHGVHIWHDSAPIVYASGSYLFVDSEDQTLNVPEGIGLTKILSERNAALYEIRRKRPD